MNNKVFYTLVAMMAVILVGIGIIAYGGSSPSVFGHSAGEVEGTVPSGGIVMFDTSCPDGWTRLSALDGKVPRGASTYGGTGGSDTHTHAAGSLAGPSHTHSAGSLAGPSHTHTLANGISRPGWGNGQEIYFDSSGNTMRLQGSSGTVYQSTLSTNTGGTGAVTGSTAAGGTGAVTGSTGSSSSWPPYLEVVWCKKD